MNKATATKVLEEVRAFVGVSEGYSAPQLMDNDHEGLQEGSWSICFEGGNVEDWAYHFRTAVPGVFVEPINHVILGVHDA